MAAITISDDPPIQTPPTNTTILSSPPEIASPSAMDAAPPTTSSPAPSNLRPAASPRRSSCIQKLYDKARVTSVERASKRKAASSSSEGGRGPRIDPHPGGRRPRRNA
ncbi:hypothetical protein VPH35_089206 [Triticum aestivum]